MANFYIENKHLKRVPENDRDNIVGLTRAAFDQLNHGAEFALSQKEQIALAIIIFGILRGSSLSIIAPLCPDYSFEHGKYTFRFLGTGIGHSAEKIANEVSNIDRSIEEIVGSHRLKFTGYYADIEANDEVYPVVTKLTQEVFLENVRQSAIRGQQFFKSKLPANTDVEVVTMLGSGLISQTEICHGLDYAKAYSHPEKLIPYRSRIYGTIFERLGINFYADNNVAVPRVIADLARLGAFAGALGKKPEEFILVESMSAMPISVYNKTKAIPIYRTR